MLVNNMPVASLFKPAKSIYSSSFLVNVESLFRLQELRNGATCALIILELKISHQVMRVEIKLLNGEGRWNLALIVNVFGIEKLLFSMILENVTCVGVIKITTLVCRLTCLVYIISLIVLEDDDIATIVSIKLAKNIIYVEGPIIGIWRHLNRMGRLTEILKRLSRHHDLCLKSFIFFL